MNGWPHPITIVDFEETAYYMMDMNGDLNTALNWTKQIRDGLELDGYCNG